MKLLLVGFAWLIFGFWLFDFDFECLRLRMGVLVLDVCDLLVCDLCFVLWCMLLVWWRSWGFT